MKYLRDEKPAWKAAVQKAKLYKGTCKGIYQSPENSTYTNTIFTSGTI
jgi:hypothetical protein